ncbi:hypothetical protein CHH61_03675 [Shouchella clausii]|uniref:Uncharacterized protein n=1 Tax=Shouchella clausii TaxID=79880 RepID=A0A268S619_SHOCL|nr:hypothetical protein [Shouchella clausii]PAF27376.1 hypothetical protein CHH61_03675 [Shouchella clausii]
MTSKPTNENFDDFSENILQDLIDEGYNGAELLAEFRNRKAQMRNATQSLVQEAKTKGKRTPIEDLFTEKDEV